MRELKAASFPFIKLATRTVVPDSRELQVVSVAALIKVRLFEEGPPAPPESTRFAVIVSVRSVRVVVPSLQMARPLASPSNEVLSPAFVMVKLPFVISVGVTL